MQVRPIGFSVCRGAEATPRSQRARHVRVAEQPGRIIDVASTTAINVLVGEHRDRRAGRRRCRRPGNLLQVFVVTPCLCSCVVTDARRRSASNAAIVGCVCLRSAYCSLLDECDRQPQSLRILQQSLAESRRWSAPGRGEARRPATAAASKPVRPPAPASVRWPPTAARARRWRSRELREEMQQLLLPLPQLEPARYHSRHQQVLGHRQVSGNTLSRSGTRAMPGPRDRCAGRGARCAAPWKPDACRR